MWLACLIAITFITTVASSVSDFRSLTIPNSHSLIVVATFILGWIISPESFGVWWAHFGAFAVFFAITYVLFCIGVFGGGDTKLGSALALWVGFKGFMIYMFYMALIGGIFGIAALVLRKKKPFKSPKEGSWIAAVQKGESAVPYGIALSAGAWAALFHTGFLYQNLHEVIKIIH